MANFPLRLNNPVIRQDKVETMNPITLNAHPLTRKPERAPAAECDEAVAEFIRTHGVTRCPTACVLPTQASPADADRLQLEAYAASRDQQRRAKAAERSQRLSAGELLTGR
jgi:hypothetical protein